MTAPMLPTMAPWAMRPMLAFDTETTGVDVESDRIVTAAVVSVNDGPRSEREWLINPGVDIPETASKIHGITTERAQRDGADPIESIDAIVKALADAARQGTPIIAMNAPFDLSILDREARRYNVPTLSTWLDEDGVDLYVIDPYVLDKYVDKYRRGSRTLTALAEHYEVPLLDKHAHTAAGDCLAAARVAWKIAKDYPGKVGQLPLPVLMTVQVAAHAEQTASLEAYKRGKGEDVSIPRDWPIRPYGGAQ